MAQLAQLPLLTATNRLLTLLELRRGSPSCATGAMAQQAVFLDADDVRNWEVLTMSSLWDYVGMAGIDDTQIRGNFDEDTRRQRGAVLKRLFGHVIRAEKPNSYNFVVFSL